MEYNRTLEVELEYQDEGCAANMALVYYQKNTHAHVTSTITNAQCAASSGDYVLHIRYRTDDGEYGEVQFEETWSRDDDADVVIEKDYYVGENLDVRRVRAGKLSCVCTVTDEPDEGTE